MTRMQANVMAAIHGRNIWDDVDFPILPPSAPQGWHGDHPSLGRIAGGGACIVDVGVWKGDSTINMAKAIKAGNIDGCVIAVDTFLGSPEHFVVPQFSGLFQSRVGRPNLYETFLSNVMHAEVQDVVVPMPQTSVTAAAILKALGIRPNVVHIDAAHDYADVLRDCEAYWELLSEGGYLIGDDYVEGWPGVIRAAGEFSAKLALPLAIERPKWILRKPS